MGVGTCTMGWFYVPFLKFRTCWGREAYDFRSDLENWSINSIVAAYLAIVILADPKTINVTSLSFRRLYDVNGWMEKQLRLRGLRWASRLYSLLTQSRCFGQHETSWIFRSKKCGGVYFCSSRYIENHKRCLGNSRGGSKTCQIK